MHPKFFLMRRLGVSRAYTRSADMANGSYPGTLVHIRYPENIGVLNAESATRNNKIESVTIEWYYYWTFCCERYCYIVKGVVND